MARWPGLLSSELNIDESFFIAGAMKLLKDPIFWRSVDTTTSGPLNIFPLILSTLFGLKIEYASARLVGLILIIISTIFLYFSIRSIYDVPIARLAIIPTVTTIALMTYSDYAHYSSEHVSIAILSALLLLVCQFYNTDPNKPIGTAFFLGFLVGTIPYAKLQATPIGMMIALVFLHILWKKNSPKKQFFRSFLSLVLGGLLFSSIVFLLLLVFSAFEFFWMSYIQQNLLYASGGANIKPLTFSEKIFQFLRMLFQSNDTLFLFSLTVLSIISGFPFLIGRRSSSSENGNSSSDTFIWVFYSLFIIVATIFSITKTGSPFPHYLLFLVIPSGFTIGIFLGELDKVHQNNLLSRKRNKSFFTTFIFGILIISSFSSSRYHN